MKMILWSIALYLFFHGILAGVQYLDAQSTQYVTCVQHFNAEAQNPFLYPEDKQTIIDALENPNAKIEVNGEKCPPLLEAHKMEIRERLEASRAG